jgi:hypothetical protein
MPIQHCNILLGTPSAPILKAFHEGDNQTIDNPEASPAVNSATWSCCIGQCYPHTTAGLGHQMFAGEWQRYAKFLPSRNSRQEILDPLLALSNEGRRFPDVIGLAR